MSLREETLAALEKAGFAPAGALPAPRDADAANLRPAREVARRLMALETVFSWAGAPEEAMSSERLRAYAKTNGLEEAMTDDERDVFQLERSEAQDEYGESIGWLLESMWPLAWALGFPREPGLGSGMIGDKVIEELFYEFLPGLDGTVEMLLGRATPRALAELLGAEDRFACASALVRGATSKQGLPRGFDAEALGDLLSERGAALRWCLAPELAWDEIDWDGDAQTSPAREG